MRVIIDRGEANHSANPSTFDNFRDGSYAPSPIWTYACLLLVRSSLNGQFKPGELFQPLNSRLNFIKSSLKSAKYVSKTDEMLY
jgi:hypothetical protein